MACDFDSSVDRLYWSVVASSDYTGQDHACVIEGLSRYLQASFGKIPLHDLEDIISKAVLKFIEKARDGSIDPSQTPAGYLVSIAYTKGVDHLNRRGREVPYDGAGEEQAEEDPEIDRVIEALFDTNRVEKAMALAHMAGEHEILDVVRVWLWRAHDLNRAPTLRHVAEILNISHTTVRTRLLQFREFLDE